MAKVPMRWRLVVTTACVLIVVLSPREEWWWFTPLLVAVVLVVWTGHIKLPSAKARPPEQERARPEP